MFTYIYIYISCLILKLLDSWVKTFSVAHAGYKFWTVPCLFISCSRRRDSRFSVGSFEPVWPTPASWFLSLLFQIRQIPFLCVVLSNKYKETQVVPLFEQSEHVCGVPWMPTVQYHGLFISSSYIVVCCFCQIGSYLSF